MSSSARRSALERFKQGLSSDEEESDYYNEEEQDNYENEMDDFVVQDKDVGYKASAHQKQAKPTTNNRYSNNTNTRTRTRQSQSYNISRRRRHNNSNTKSNNSPSRPTQSKKQSTMKNFFKPSNAKPQPRNVNNRNKKLSKLQKKKKNKPTQNTENDDNFLADIMANMDGDSDDNINNNDSNDINNDAFMDNNDIELTNNNISMASTNDTYLTEPQTPRCNNINTQDTIQTHHTQTQKQNHTNEPPKKRVKYSPAVNNTNVNDKMEMSDDENKCEQNENVNDNNNNNNMDFLMKNDDSNDSKQSETQNIKATASTTKPENTDTYPQCGAGYIDFFWFDAYEDPIKKPGQIYLFGKTFNKTNQKWQSICVFISNIQRTIYVLPRLKNKESDIETGERVEFINVYNELNSKRSHLGINKFAAKPIQKKYCFRERKDGIPSVATYLKCCYSFADLPFMGHGFETGSTYSKIFGVRSTALELFILDKQIMGPCWLRLPLKKPTRIVSWCKKELMCDNMDEITVLSSNYPSPHFKVLSLSFQTILNEKKEHEIAAISGFIDNSVCVDHNSKRNNYSNRNKSSQQQTYFTFIRKINRNPFPYDLEKQLKLKGYNLNNSTFKTFSTERELLTYFTLRIQQSDPDVIVGHKLYDFLLDVILHRMDKLNVNMWSKIGRLRKGKIPFIRGRLMRKYLGSGRLFVDTFISSQEFLSHQKTYTLSHLCKELLGVENHENLNNLQIQNKWFDGVGLCSIITHCCNDSNLIYKLQNKLQVLALTKELTNLCGNLWNRSLLSQRAERNEWLLLHEFHRNGYIMPERLTKKEKMAKGIIANTNSNGKKRGKAQYAGGLVLDPQRGLYDKYVICLDFNSLYPSIIQEYNLCFTSTQHWKYEKNKNKNQQEKQEESNIESMRASIAAEIGILPRVIGVLLTRRSTVKKLLKNTNIESEKRRLDIQQKALKLVANSMYGCLGFSHSRFYCEPIAALITALGRESLMKASEIASSIDNLKVIYGDTDSIFIYTDCDNLIKARNFAKEIKKKVNKTYKKMYLELDYVFSKMLLLRKKKYAAIKVVSFDTDASTGQAKNIVTKKEIKGLDLVRRDWSIISRDVGKKVLDIILSGDEKYSAADDIIIGVQELLQEYRKLFDENKIELNRFKITKKLTKKPKDYPDPTKQAHVMVAMQMQKELGMNVNTGSFIEYIVCKQNRSGSQNHNKSIAQRAYHIKEIEKSMKENNNNNNADDESNNVLQVDREWYLEQQILPPVGRYCDPIEGTDMGHLAHALGLDSNKFKHLIRNNQNNINNDEIDDDIDDKILRITNPLQKYSEICEPLKIKCGYCNTTYDFGGVFNFKKIDAKCGLICPTTNCKGIVSSTNDINRIKNTLSMQIWNFIYQYYSREYICVDIECNYKTQQLPLNNNTNIICPKIGCSAKMKESYSSNKLFDQLRYFAFLFDRNEQEKLLQQQKIAQKENKALHNTKLTKYQEVVFDDIYKWIKKTILQKSKYYFIDSKVIFKYLM